MIPRRTLALARSQSGNLTRAFCRSSVDFKGIAINGMNEHSSYTPSSSRSSVSALSSDLRSTDHNDLSLFDSEVNSDPGVHNEMTESFQDVSSTKGEAIDASEVGREEIAIEKSQSKATEAAGAPSVADLARLTSPQRRRAANRNPFEPKGSFRVLESAEPASGLRERVQTAKARGAASTNVVINSRRARLEEQEEDQYGLGLESNTNEEKREQVKPLAHQISQNKDISSYPADQGQSQQEEQSSQDKTLRSKDAMSRLLPTTGPSQIHKTTSKGDSNREKVLRSTSSSRNADALPEMRQSPRSDVIQATGRVRLDTALLQKASTENWPPLTPSFLDGQREGCAEAGFEDWTVFTKIGSGGLRIRLFVRRIITDSTYGLSLMTALSTSIQHYQRIPDTLHYRQLANRSAILQVEIAANLIGRVGEEIEEENNSRFFFQMYPDVSQDQIRLIRQVNLVLKQQDDIQIMMDESHRGQISQRDRAIAASLNEHTPARLRRPIKEEEKSGYTEIPRLLSTRVSNDQNGSRLRSDDHQKRRREANIGGSQERQHRTMIGLSQDRLSENSNLDRINDKAGSRSSSFLISPYGHRKNKRNPSMVSSQHEQWRELSNNLLKKAPLSRTSGISVPSSQLSGSTSALKRDQEDKAILPERGTKEINDGAKNTGIDARTNQVRDVTLPISGSVADEKQNSVFAAKSENLKAGPAIEEATPMLTDKDGKVGRADDSSREPSQAEDKNEEMTKDEPVESAIPVSIDGDQAKSSRNVGNSRETSSQGGHEGIADLDEQIAEAPTAVDAITPVHIDGDQAKGSAKISESTTTESTKTQLEQQAVESSAECSNQDSLAISSSSEGAIEESTPVAVDGEQARGGVKEMTLSKKEQDSASPRTELDSSHESIEEATPVNLDESQARQTADSSRTENDVAADIDPGTVEEAIKRRSETIENVEDAVKESLLEEFGGEDKPVDEATPVNVEGEQVGKNVKGEEEKLKKARKATD